MDIYFLLYFSPSSCFPQFWERLMFSRAMARCLCHLGLHGENGGMKMSYIHMYTYIHNSPQQGTTLAVFINWQWLSRVSERGLFQPFPKMPWSAIFCIIPPPPGKWETRTSFLKIPQEPDWLSNSPIRVHLANKS